MTDTTDFTFVVADIHGRLDLLTKAIALIERTHELGRVVFTGDYVDRGADSAGVVEKLMRGPRTPQWRWICLRGNHEDMALSEADRVEAASIDDSPIAYFTGKPGDWLTPYHRRWIKSLPYHYEDTCRIYVHAMCDPYRPLDDQRSDDLVWSNADLGALVQERGDHPPKHVVHGHVANPRGPIITPYETNLDTYAVGTGRLCVGMFADDTPGGPIEIFEVFA